MTGRKFLLTIGFTFAIFQISCLNRCGSGREDLSPEAVVQAYLNVVFNMKSLDDRSQLLEYTTGPLKESLAAASDGTITEAYLDTHYKLEKFSIVERRDRTPRETEITFQIVYKNMAPEGPDDHLKPEEIPTVTVDNTVSLIRENKRWYIKEILNKKSSFQFPLSPESMHVKPASVTAPNEQIPQE